MTVDSKFYSINENTSNFKDKTFNFVENNWNDFGYYTLFDCFYGKEKLGHVKVFCNLDPESNGHVVNVLSSNNSIEKWMMGEDIFFYNKLKNIDQSIAIDFLRQMQDLSLNPKGLKKLKNSVNSDDRPYNMVDDSLFRVSDISELYNFSNCLYEINYKDYQKHFFNLVDSMFKLIDSTNNNENLDELIKFLNSNAKLEDFYVNQLNSKVQLKFESSLIDFAERSKNENSLAPTIVDVLDQIRTNNPSWIPRITNLIGENENVKEIIKEIDAIKSELKVDNKELENIRLGQYTPLKTLPYLISDKKTFLRFTNAKQMNDPLEGKALNNYLKFSEDNKMDDYRLSNIYVASATSSLDSLPMWKQYAEDATGVCLIYDNSFLKEIKNERYRHISPEIYRVCYLKPDNKVMISDDLPDEDSKFKADKILNYLGEIKKQLEEIKNEKESNDLNIVKAYLNSVEYLFKKMDYSYENEYRFILDLKGKFNLAVCDSNDKTNEHLVPFLRAYIIAKFSDDKSNKSEEDNREMDVNKKLSQYGLPVLYKEVILGPKSDDIDYIAPYIKYHSINNENSKEIKVNKSEINYR